MSDTLLDEQARLVKEREEKGTHCKACGQFVKLYKRPIHSSMAYALIAFYRLVKGDTTRYEHINDIVRELDHKSAFNGRGDFAKLENWGLVEAMPDDPSERYAGRTNGKWKLTQKGCDFILNRISLPRYSLIYNDRFLGHDGKQVTIVDCLGRKFNYGSLMGGSL